MLKKLPERSVVIGRVRSDAKLCFEPDPRKAAATGRRRVYGEPAASPAELLADEAVPVRKVRAWAAGREHEFPVKTLGPVLWRSGSGPRPLRLVVIKPLRYRLNKRSRLLYRQPAFLIVTDPDMRLEDVVQRYIWRWEIELNFRDELSGDALQAKSFYRVCSTRQLHQTPQKLHPCLAAAVLSASP